MKSQCENFGDLGILIVMVENLCFFLASRLSAEYISQTNISPRSTNQTKSHAMEVGVRSHPARTLPFSAFMLALGYVAGYVL
jgi:hypothetical protein